MRNITTNAIVLPSLAVQNRHGKIIPLYNKELIKNRNEAISKLCINASKGSIILEISDILRLESASNYTTIHTTNSKKYFVSKTMKTLIDQLPSDQFIRCHHSHFVNINQIVKFTKESLLLHTSVQIPIARRKYKDVALAIRSNCISI